MSVEKGSVKMQEPQRALFLGAVRTLTGWAILTGHPRSLCLGFLI